MLSVIMIVKNEERMLRRCLEAIQWADEIIVLDSGSTDDTLAIAKEYTDKVYSTDWPGYGIQKQRALDYATGDWILNLDADEIVDANLKEAILQVMAENQYNAFRVPIRMVFYGKPLHYSSSPQRHVRLFQREGAQFSSDLVHEKIMLSNHHRIGTITPPLMHYSFRDLTHLIDKMNRYSSYTAKMRQQRQQKPSLIKTLLGSSWMFLRCYFLQRGLMDGKEGFVLAMLHAQASLYRGLKQLYPDQA